MAEANAMPATMKAWLVRQWGGPDTIHLEQAPVPTPGPGQVLIRTRAVGLNFYETLQIEGKYQVRPPLPFSPGGEVSGVVEAVGAGVDNCRVGERVAAVPFSGGMAEFTLAPAAVTFPIPEAMTWAEAAALPIVYQTSFFGLRDRAQLAPGEWLLVHAGASGVGMAAIQLGKAWGARVIATASSPEKREFARAQGANEVLDYSTPEWVEAIRRITAGRGADVIYDPAGGDTFDLSTKCLAPLGRLLVVGFASGRIPTIAANRILLKNISIVGVYWGGHIERDSGYARRTHDELMRMYAAGAVKPAVTTTYSFENAIDGLRALAERRVVGKAVVRFDA